MRVSLVIAVYNGTWCIERALDSVLGQTCPPDEIWICDDGSTDGTPDLVERRYGQAVKVLRLPHRNAAATRSVGLERAEGDWLAFMDADDTWLPEKLERQIRFIEAHPEIRFLASDGLYVSDTEVLRPSWLSDYFEPVGTLYGDLFPLLIERCFMLHSSILVERGAFHEVGGLDPSMQYSYDYDIALKVLGRYPGAVLADRLITYRWSPNQLSRRIEARYRDDLEVMRRAERGFYADRPGERQRAAERAAALEYDVGLLCMRSSRVQEGRQRLRRAATRGPLARRALALAGSWLPGWMVPLVIRTAALKSVVHQSRENKLKIPVTDQRRDVA